MFRRLTTCVSSAVHLVAGCITPGGDFVVPHRGRVLLGSEKLLMQGIPCDRLLLGNETEVQLGDLAGNASKSLFALPVRRVFRERSHPRAGRIAYRFADATPLEPLIQGRSASSILQQLLV